MYTSFENLTWYGRTLDHENIRYFDYSASGFSFIFTGKKVVATFISDSKNFDDNTKAVLGVFITPGDKTTFATLPNEPDFKIILTDKTTEVTLYDVESSTTQEKFHSQNNKKIPESVCITVLKLSEAAFASAGLLSLDIEGEVRKIPSENLPKTKIEFIGDSITCGYGIEGEWGKDLFTTKHERPDLAYAIQTAKLLNAEPSLCSWSGIGITSNYVDPATVNLPETSLLMPSLFPYTDKSLSLRLKLEPEVWDESNFSPDIIVVNLGTNDISWVRGLEERRLNFRAVYRQLLEAIHRRSPKAKICCCLGVMGTSLNETVQEAVNLFNEDFPKVKIQTVFFVEQDPADGIATDWHPSAKTHKKIAEQLTLALKNDL